MIFPLVLRLALVGGDIKLNAVDNGFYSNIPIRILYKGVKSSISIALTNVCTKNNKEKYREKNRWMYLVSELRCMLWLAYFACLRRLTHAKRRIGKKNHSREIQDCGER
jgi:hypothetical protein